MSETIDVACMQCGEPITFEVEDWADPPERAFCDDDCFEDHEAAAPEQTIA